MPDVSDGSLMNWTEAVATSSACSDNAPSWIHPGASLFPKVRQRVRLPDRNIGMFRCAVRTKGMDVVS